MSKYNYRDFYQFGQRKDSHQVSDESINSWIEDCVKTLEENKEMESHTIAFGNARVIVFRCYEEDGKKHYYEVIVAKNQWEGDIYDF